MKPEYDTHYTSAILKNRGWTDALIKTHLGTPDLIDDTYHRYRYTNLYSMDRVHSIEESTEWAEIMAKSKARSLAAKASAAVKREKLLASIEQIKIEVPTMSLDTLTEKAVASYNRLHRGEGRKVTAAESDASFLNRISVNYLRHELTTYDSHLGSIYRKVGVRDAYLEINRIIYAAIAETYPSLDEECKSQMNSKDRRSRFYRRI